ncbi:hypothetical protein EXU85_03765 [Spirosoma sp. KCTC 42546]|uniref:hypothetical protein n=1 Tax=Spirosoma sp. KCTC 42546 TaxID=2520506 RepID=UPI00115C2733|nr:hypothetical protein [Spirosoma sp. KCTC 42546]QDK77756.1 hypothetical protein EXU85_03765 [Spirosoma sp. KCTC 42546]
MDRTSSFGSDEGSENQGKLDLVANLSDLLKLRNRGHFHKSYEGLIQFMVMSYEIGKNKVFDIWLEYYRNSLTLWGFDFSIPRGGRESKLLYTCEKKIINDERAIELIRAFLKSKNRFYLAEIQKAAQLLSELNLDIPKGVRILSENKVVDWELISKGEKHAVSNDNNKAAPKLSLREVALLYIYRDQTIERIDSNTIAKHYGYTSGEKLMQHYNKLSQTNERTGLEGKEIIPMINSMKKVKPFLTNIQQKRIDTDLLVLEGKRNSPV